MQLTSTEGRHVELYVRSLASGEGHERQEEAITRLQSLVADGPLDGFDVRVWGAGVCPSSCGAETDVGRTVLDRLDRIEQWAADTDRSVDAVLRTDEHRSFITNETHEVTRFPVLALAEFEGGELVGFAPCYEGGRFVSVADRLDALSESGDRRRPVGVTDGR